MTIPHLRSKIGSNSCAMVDVSITSALNVGKLEHNVAKGHLWALICASFQPVGWEGCAMVLGLVLVLPLPSARTTVGPQRCSGSHQLGQPWVVPHFLQLNGSRILWRVTDPCVFRSRKRRSSYFHPWPFLVLANFLFCFSPLATLTLIYISSLY